MRRILPPLVIIGLIALAWSSGLAGAINWGALARHHRTLADWIAEHPLLGGGSYVVAYAAAVALSLPVGLVFTASGGLLFGPVAGALLAATGATLGATLLFLIARSVLGDAAAHRGGPRAAALRERLARDGFNYLLAIRLVPLFPFWLVNLAAALCGIPLLSYVAATALGVLPVSAVLAWIGAGLTRVLASGDQPNLDAIVSWPVLAPLIGLAVLALAPLLWRVVMPDCDLAVIGAGAAGLSVTAAAAQLGLRVTLIERARMGGECLNAGCVPSKALLAASHAMQAARAAGRFGVRLAEPVLDWAALRAHVHGTIESIAPTDSEARFRSLGAEVLRSEARFVAPDTLAVDGRRIIARRIIVAAGSRPAMPVIPGLDQVPCWTNETLFDLTGRPDHLIILGGGPIGLEMADAFSGLGCRVTIIEAGRIASRDDPELVQGLRAALTRQGVEIIEEAGVDRVSAGPIVHLGDGRTVSGSHLLVATGRRPNVETLDLEAGAVAATAAGISTDLGLRSVSNRRVFAVGDIANPQGIGPRAFTHVGSAHAALVVRRALFRLPARLSYAALPRVTYTRLELAQAGLTEAEARAAGHDIQVLRWPLTDNDRAVTERETAGMVKLVTARNRIIGAGILSPGAGDMIGLWCLAIAQRTRLSALASLVLPYPTRSEAGKRAAGTAFASRLFAPGTRRLVGLLAKLP